MQAAAQLWYLDLTHVELKAAIKVCPLEEGSCTGWPHTTHPTHYSNDSWIIWGPYLSFRDINML